MDLDTLTKILRELILEKNRVSLPGMGSFIAEMAPSVFSDRARIIHPPFRRILFRPNEIWNDGLLEGIYAQRMGISEEEAKSDILEFVNDLKSELKENKSYKLKDFGTMRATEQNDYFFVAEKDLFNYLESFGLKPVNIKLMPKRGVVEEFPGKPETKISSVVPPEKPVEEFQENTVTNIPEQPAVLQQEKIPSVKKETAGFVRKVVVTLSIIFAIILLVVLLFVFKDQIKPFWEWILYSKEEREFLRQLGSTN